MAFEAGRELGELRVAVEPRDFDPVQRPRAPVRLHRPAVGVHSDLEAAPEADEITGRADMLVGHERPVARENDS